MLHSPHWSVHHLFKCLLDKFLSNRISVVEVVARNRFGFSKRGTCTFLFEAIKVFRKQHAVLVVLAHQNLGKRLKVKVVSSVDRQHCVVKVGSLEYLSHILDFLQAQSLAVFKDDGLTDTFHTVLYQETVQVSVTRLVEVFAVYFCENKLYFKLLAELFRLA